MWPPIFGVMPHIVFEALFPDVQPPSRATAGSAGYDLAVHLVDRRVRVWRDGMPEERDVALHSGEATLVLVPGEKALVPLGFRARLPDGFEAQIRPRSGTSVKTDLVIVNSPGTVDGDFPDEWCVPVRNGGAAALRIAHGDRIAQMVIARYESLDFAPGVVARSTDRRGGFGSTDGASRAVPGAE